MKSKGAKARREKRVVSAKKRLSTHTSGFERTTLRLPDGVSFWTPKDPGTYRIEILPYKVTRNPYFEEGGYAFERTYWMHRNIGPENNSYVCLAKELGKKCPVCEHRSKLAQDPNGDEEVIKALAPKQRQLFNVYDHKQPDKGVQVWEVSYHLFGKYLDNKIKNADPEDQERYEQFANEEDGLTLRVTASQESTGSTNFLDFGDIEFKERKDALDPELFDQAVCLDDCIKTLDYNELKKILLQLDDDEDAEDSDDDDDTPKKKGKKTVAEDDDEDDTDGDDDDDADAEDGDDDDSDDGDDDSDADELAVGSMVTGKYKKQTRTGQIKKITKGNKGQQLAHVKVRGMDQLWIADLSELSPVESEDSEEEEDDDDDDTPPPAKKGKGKPAPEDEDDDDLDLGDDDDDDDDAPPPPKKKGGKKPADDDDDDLPFDLDDDEDDEPDPTPKDKGKGKRKVK
jgi:hypothetical protein